MRLIGHPDEWAGEIPAVLVALAVSPEARHFILRQLVSRVAGCAVADVRIVHARGRAPLLVEPHGLVLSSASRDGVAAVAVGRGPLGVDIEAVEPGREPPWYVLHERERALLASLSEGEREREFARIWAAKEAYLKALGLGLDREPAGFAILPGEDGTCRAQDPERPGSARIWTALLSQNARQFAVALAELG